MSKFSYDLKIFSDFKMLISRKIQLNQSNFDFSTQESFGSNTALEWRTNGESLIKPGRNQMITDPLIKLRHFECFFFCFFFNDWNVSCIQLFFFLFVFSNCRLICWGFFVSYNLYDLSMNINWSFRSRKIFDRNGRKYCWLHFPKPVVLTLFYTMHPFRYVKMPFSPF